MRIDQNNIALNAYRSLDSAQGTRGKGPDQRVEGERSDRRAGDAPGVAIRQSLPAQLSGLRQATRNAQDGIAVVQTAAGALTDVHAMLHGIHDAIGKSAQTSPTDAAAREASQNDIVRLRSDIDHIGETTTFNGQKLLNGSFGSDFHIGAPVASTDRISVAIDDIRITAGTNASFSALAGIDASNPATLGSAQTLVDGAITAVSTARGQLAAAQNQFESVIANLQVGSENLTASRSRIHGTDSALELVSFTRNQILSQPATALAAQANAAPQSVLKLLQ